ncbi:MAG TPA: hypothetical protein VGR45_07925 [Stellaceae bacterium]|nr:hypothetical protein [Stellaceae bacterium]
MHKLSVAAVVFAAAEIAFFGPATAASGVGQSPALSGITAPGPDHAIIFVGGMGGSGGGMGGGAGGMGGAGGGMGGGHLGSGDPFGPVNNFARPSEDQPADAGQPADYTYQCVTPAGRCPFVARAALRSSSLRSGADCVCGDGSARGRVE